MSPESLARLETASSTPATYQFGSTRNISTSHLATSWEPGYRSRLVQLAVELRRVRPQQIRHRAGANPRRTQSIGCPETSGGCRYRSSWSLDTDLNRRGR